MFYEPHIRIAFKKIRPYTNYSYFRLIFKIIYQYECVISNYAMIYFYRRL